jgi:hypothetical protein
VQQPIFRVTPVGTFAANMCLHRELCSDGRPRHVYAMADVARTCVSAVIVGAWAAYLSTCQLGLKVLSA